MRYLIIFALVYFAFRTVRNLLSNVRIVSRDSVEIKDQEIESSPRIKVDESDIEDADFTDVE